MIAATNQDLATLVNAKKFRQDLFHRLNTFTITIPPLRERTEDTLELTRVFVAEYNQKYGKNKVIREAGIEALKQHSFTGNVRELQNILKEAVVICESRIIDKYIVAKIKKTEVDLCDSADSPKNMEIPFDLQNEMDAFEKQLFMLAAGQCRTTSAKNI